MTPQTLIDQFTSTKQIPIEVVKQIQEDASLRTDLVNYFRTHQNRDFVIAVIDELVRLRLHTDMSIPMEDLMFACYLLILHGKIEDSYKIWEVKITDFDTYCGFDSQLVFFAGHAKTVDYLRSLNITEAQKAAEFISECVDVGGLDMEENGMPWFV